VRLRLRVDDNVDGSPGASLPSSCRGAGCCCSSSSCMDIRHRRSTSTPLPRSLLPAAAPRIVIIVVILALLLSSIPSWDNSHRLPFIFILVRRR
jgi:hypothetical protein